MIEVNFKDRIPREPGQVTITPVAGATNTYILERNDDPSEVGTPLDKATFDSIIHSRLTGRYYKPSVSRTTTSSQVGVTTNPIPSSGWVENSAGTEIKSGSYTIRASSVTSSSDRPLFEAFDGSTSTRWESAPERNPWVMITLPVHLNVKKIKMRVAPHSTSWSMRTIVQGSNDMAAWTDLLTVDGRQSAVTEYALSTTGDYLYYRLAFSFPGHDADGGGQTSVYEFQFSDYSANQYKNSFSLSGVPEKWDDGQRITIQTPSGFSTVAVASNTLNGVTVNTILQPSKRYELRYTGTAFVAKEV